MKTVIDVPDYVIYLNEWNGFELPNGIFNKGTTACGATTLSLTDRYKTIICSPRNELLRNKYEQHPKTLLVIGGCKQDEISEYIQNNDVPKILVSYDSFYKLASCIEDNSEWRVVVDEFQYLLSDSGMKSEVEIRFLKALKEFPYVTYISATPILEKYIKDISWFNGMDYTELVWHNVEKVRLIRRQSKKPINAAVEIVKTYKSGKFPFIEIDGSKIESRECVIYLNSVNNIVNIIDQAKLKPEDVNIIVGSNEENDKQISKIGKGFKRGRIPLKDEPHKMFTFCTSTAFAGCDFYSTCASSYVISDSNRVHTSIDIATDLVQIAGRQRLSENPFRRYLTFIYNFNEGEMDKKAFNRKMEEKKRVSYLEIEDNNKVTDEALRCKRIRDVNRLQKMLGYGESFIMYDERQDKFIFNEMAYANECYYYDLQRHNYINGIIVRKLIDDKTFDLEGDPLEMIYGEHLKCSIKKESFADKMKRYCDYKSGDNKFDLFAEMIASKQLEIKTYYEELGGDRIKALGYKESALKNEIKGRNENGRLSYEFGKLSKSGERMTTDQIKTLMNEVYERYGIKKKAVVTHLEKKYGIRVHPCKVTLNNGERVSGYCFL